MISSYFKGANNQVYINFLKYYQNEDFVHYKDLIDTSDRSLLILVLVFLIIAFILQTVMVIFSYRLLSVTPYVPYHIFTGFIPKPFHLPDHFRMIRQMINIRKF